MPALDDVLRTGPFTPESLERIAQASLRALCQRAEARLGFRLTYGEEAVKALAARFNRETGAGGIGRGRKSSTGLWGKRS